MGSELIKLSGVKIRDFCKNKEPRSDTFKETGVSQIEIKAKNLLIYSKNGAKLKRAGFKINSSTNIAFRNVQFDEMWEWEDTFTNQKGEVQTGRIGDYDRWGWAYFYIFKLHFIV